jgi:hypothetical protein
MTNGARASTTYGDQISFAVEAFVRSFVAPFDSDRAATRGRLYADVGLRLVTGESPEAIVADLAAALGKTLTTAPR